METGTVVRAARYHATGIPADVLRVDEITLPPPAPGQVRVRMLAAPINPADLNMMEGKYGEARPLPDVPGNEGVGRVVATGEGVPSSWVDQQVLVDSEAWREQGNWDVSGLVRVPDTIAPRHAAFLRVNPPTAWRLLHDFVSLQPDDWIVQNLAGSSVGRAVVEIARQRGWKTLNVARRPEAAEELRALGADAVLVDGPSLAEESRAVLGGGRPKLGLNAVGGAAATRLAGLLATGGMLVTYGAMSKEALKIPNGFLIFRDISFRGFWLTRWLRGAGEEARKEMFDGIFALAEEGLFRPPVAAEFPLGRVKEAVTAASEGARGKILLQLGD